MCGRYRLRRFDLLQAAFQALGDVEFEEFSELDIPWWNIAPSLQVPILRMNSSGQPVIAPAKWGFIPSWAKELPKVRPINAKSETVSSNGMFRRAFRSSRCLIPADGFYEWQGKKPPKQPYFIHMKDDGVFCFAGLWDRWKPKKDAEPVDTVTILTTDANELITPIHNRMPVILARRDYGRWLNPSTPSDETSAMLKSYPADEMDAYPISPKVNNTRNDGPELVQPATSSTGLFDS